MSSPSQDEPKKEDAPEKVEEPKKEKKEKKEKAPKVEKVKPVWGDGSKKKEKKPAAELKPAFVNTTPPGEKKDMTTPMAAGYEPDAVEAAWDAWWNKQGYFTPKAQDCKGTMDHNKFVMVIPPPNVTGSLHLGHAITAAIEDCLTRWHRMQGHATLWVPGTDHAGIATQSVVERLMLKNEGLTRHDLGREKFLERVWAWKEKYGANICNQFRRLGASTDWSREAFTMDKNLTRAVKHSFVEFHKQGLIYRDMRLVNWSSHLRTALSDLEVDYEDITGRTLRPILGSNEKVEIGVMCHFKYKVKGLEDTWLTVATTRLETMLGDTAVVVNPADDRYKHLVGKKVEHPFFPDRDMVVIADSYVDKEFGTGCMKVTPGHDHNDYKLGRQHNLPRLNMLREDGHINEENGAQWAGKHRFVARREIEEELKKLGLWVKKEPHTMRIGFCSRSGDIIEPYLKPQWWMDCKELAARSVQAVKSKELKITPSFHEAKWFEWLENIQDWCISRQLWWGHQIPAYKVTHPVQEKEKWYAATNDADALKQAQADFGPDVKIEQDEDVLDTWFSSGLFPFSVMGWPDQTPDMEAFFPGSLLETGHDILFFWVARMVMMSLGLTGKLPFHTVYLHAMVRDKNGEKMSKSKGNVIDPLEVVDGCTLQSLHDKLLGGNLPEKEIKKATADQVANFPEGIPRCGADALRIGLLAYTAQGRNVNLDLARVVGYRHFCNKLWNATRFALEHVSSPYQYPGYMSMELELRWEDQWILSKLARCCNKTDTALKEYQFADAVQAVYSFWLYELCDVYLELLKPRLHTHGKDEEAPVESDAEKADKKVARDTLYTCLDVGLRLLHPFIPFVTEELYHRLPNNPAKYESICIAPYPSQGAIAWINEKREDEMAIAKEITGSLRSAMAQLQVLPNMNPKAYVVPLNEGYSEKVTPDVVRISKVLSRVGSLEKVSEAPKATLASPIHSECKISLDVKDLVDLSKEQAQLQKKMDSCKKTIEAAQKKMAAASYATTPDHIKEKDAEKVAEQEKQIEEIQKSMDFLKEAMGV